MCASGANTSVRCTTCVSARLRVRWLLAHRLSAAGSSFQASRTLAALVRWTKSRLGESGAGGGGGGGGGGAGGNTLTLGSPIAFDFFFGFKKVLRFGLIKVRVWVIKALILLALEMGLGLIMACTPCWTCHGHSQCIFKNMLAS